MDIRNIAIIAHVDHGKTTLTDALLRQTGMVTEGVTMDSNALEQERGITIYAKNTSLYYKDTKINIVDTPGHADFGSEVERVLRAIDSVLLVVDAQEGPMPQTRFVLKKSLELGLKPIVVINKIDKPAARPKEVVDEVLELFFELGANEKQLDFPVVYAIGRQGIAKLKIEDESSNLNPLLDTILKEVPAANKKPGTEQADANAPFVMQVFNLAYDNFLGRLAIGRVYSGSAAYGQMVYASAPAGVNGQLGTKHSGKITKIFTFEGTARKEVQKTEPGDIVMIAGLPEIYIGETVSTLAETPPLPAITIDEPTIAMNFLVNDSPFAGREGSLVTGRQIRERLERELEINVGLKVDFSSSEAYKVFGRGELHISILLENMRREGYEVQVSQPQVIIKEEGGKKMEPFEEAIIDVPTVSSSVVIEKLGRRRGILMSMTENQNSTRLVFEIPTRGLLGYRNEFIIDTKGEGILSSRFVEFREHAGEIDHRQAGAMISMAPGKVLAFSLDNLQQRGVLYVEPGDEVYEGEVIGNTTKGEDLYVNPTKGKQLTNMRASGSDDSIYLAPAWRLSIERAMEIMGEDEYIEITPKNVRLRKKFLTKIAKDRAERTAK